MSDDEQHNQEIESASAGASLTFPMQCSALRKNGFVIIKGRPCKIMDMSTSKTGKHGHAKVHIVGIDIFTSKKLEEISPSTHNVDVPNIERIEYALANIDDDYLNLIDENSTTKGLITKDDIKVPEGELGDTIKKQFEEGKELTITILKAMNQEVAISFKLTTSKDNDN